MKHKLRRFMLVVLVLTMAGGAIYGLIAFEPTKGLHSLDGGEVDMEYVVSSKPIIILVYWHSACPTCKDQIQELGLVQMFFDSVYMEQAQSIGYVIGVNVGDKDSVVKDYWLASGAKYPTLAGGTLPTAGTPTTQIYVEGQLYKQFIGLVTYTQIMQVIMEE